MNTYKAAGIALRSLKLGEADKIVTFLTTKGKIDAMAKGVRRPKSKFGGRLEPGNDLELVFAKGRTLDTVTGVQVKKMRPWIRSDLDRAETAFNILEMADKFGEEGSDDIRLLTLAGAALDALRTEERLPLLRLAYDIKVLATAGFLPHLSGCVRCGAKDVAGLSVADGGLVCEACRGPRELKPVRKGAPALVLDLLRKRFAELDQVEASEPLIAAADDMIWEHIAYHVPGRFKTRKQFRDPEGEKGIST